MQQVDLDAAIDFATTSALNGRLAFLVGAGLSMPSPSMLPKAADLADAAKRRYAADYGQTRPPLPDRLEDQADFFLAAGQLGSVFLTRYIDKDVFSAPHNAGHSALADLLLSNAVDLVVTTNVDTMIERAGEDLLGRVGKGIDGAQMAAIPQGAAPLLKIHGCWSFDFQHTVWTVKQLDQDPVKPRVESASAWLTPRLMNRDLVILGFSTDWDYLNELLGKALEAVAPARVLMVNPSTEAELEEAAPRLIEVGRRAQSFMHLKTGGDVFLDRLRLEFSKTFVRQTMAQGIECYKQLKGDEPAGPDLEPPNLTNDEFWQIRRDLLGCKPNKPAVRAAPEEDEFLGMTLLLLRAAGAVCEGGLWTLNGTVIRVLRCPPRFLHSVEADYSREVGPLAAPDVIVAVGSRRMGLRPNFARSPTGTVVRGGNAQWMTTEEAIEVLEL